MVNIKVTYPDGTFTIRSLKSQIDSIDDETLEFKTWFLYRLLKEQLPVPTRYGEYSLTDESITDKKIVNSE